jgi:hypothetical protein
MKRLHTALILAIGFTFVLGSLLAQVPVSTSGAPHWQEKINLSKYALHQDVFITSGITLLNSAGTANIGELSSADLVALAGSSSTELGYLTGVTAGTATASKALVVGTTKNIDTLDVASLKLGGVTITPTPAEINKLVQGTAAGKKINGGTSNVTTSATVASGLSAITSVVASLGVAPDANTSLVHAEVSGTNVVLYTYTATGESTTTLIPSTTETAIHWIAFGT